MAKNQSFDELKARLPIVDVVAHYIPREKLQLPEDKTQIRVSCPRCDSDQNSLSISPSLGKFTCFRCKSKNDLFQGDQIDFVAGMENIDRIGAGKVLNKRYPIDSATDEADTTAKKPSMKEQKDDAVLASPIVNDVKESDLNKPLGWELKGIDQKHEALRPLGLPDEIIDLYGIGYYTGKSFPEGSAICPIRNETGEVLGYFGFTLEREVVYPKKFNTALDLFGVDQLIEPGILYIVADPLDVFIAKAYGLRYIVATMESVPSKQHIAYLNSTDYDRYIYLYTETQSSEQIGGIVQRLAPALTSFSIKPFAETLESL